MLIFLLLFNLSARAEMKIAVIDSGINLNTIHAKLCPESKDFSGSGTLADPIDHGTEVVKILAANIASPVSYCIMVLKIFGSPFGVINDSSAAALEYAIKNKASIINMSYSGSGYDKKEDAIMKLALKNKIPLVIAAGNKSEDLDFGCNAYPACNDRRATVVGFDDKGNTSNYGKIVKYTTTGVAETPNKKEWGSSFAAPRIAARIINGELKP